MPTIRRYLALTIVLLLAASGVSLQLKAAIGVAPFDALNQSLAYVLNIRVGDIVMIVNLVFIASQIVILKRETNWRILLQVFIGAVLGQFVNFFYYGLFNQLIVDNYILRLLLLVAGSLWVPIFIGSVMVLDLVTMPVENFSMLISNNTKYSFGQIRQFIDVICVVISLALTFVFSVPFAIREGTIISAFTFGPLLTLYMPKIEVLFRNWKLIE